MAKNMPALVDFRVAGLSPRRAKFVLNYLVTNSVKEASEAAGYKNSAGFLLKDPLVAEAIRRQQTRLAERYEISVDNVMKELSYIAYARMTDYISVTSAGDVYIDLSKMTPEQAAAVAEITIEDYTDGRGDDARDIKKTKFRLHGKREALVDLAKHLGALKDNAPLLIQNNVTNNTLVQVGDDPVKAGDAYARLIEGK